MVSADIGVVVQPAIQHRLVARIGIVDNRRIRAYIYPAAETIGLKVKCLVGRIGIVAKLVIIVQRIVDSCC